MKVDLQKYELVSKIACGGDLTLIFRHKQDKSGKKILQLDNAVGFFDLITKKDVVWLRVDEPGGSYTIDLSLRLDRPEIKGFQEIFLFTDSDGVEFCFRAVAEQVYFRNGTDNDKWLK